MSETAPARRSPPWLRPAIDYLGPAAFVLGFFLTGRNLVHATWWLVGGSAAALALAYAVERRVAPLPAIWGGAALVFGVLTLVFHDPTIIKMKTTFIDLALGAALLIGLGLKRNVLKLLIGEAIHLSDEGWRKLAFRYAVFFLCMAGLNEIVWRTQPDSVWVLFRRHPGPDDDPRGEGRRDHPRGHSSADGIAGVERPAVNRHGARAFSLRSLRHPRA